MARPQYNILILNGPNLNMLGIRETQIYGAESLSALALKCEEHAGALGMGIDFRQSNHEGEMISIIQDARDEYEGMVINPAGYGHTSVALHDALKILDIPVIEVHLSNIHKRESFRHHSYVSSAVEGVICGLGGQGYLLALDALHALIGDA